MRNFLNLIRRLLDPLNVVKLHRKLSVKFLCTVGYGLRVTHRTEIFHHGNDKGQIVFGKFVVLDGTIEVYEHGNIIIGNYTFIGRARIYCAASITIGDYCLISDNVCVMDSDLHPLSALKRRNIAEYWANGKFPDIYTATPNAPVSIGNHCWIGYGSAILKGVHIGEGAVVGSNSVVTKDVPPWTIVAGNPARIIREIPENER